MEMIWNLANVESRMSEEHEEEEVEEVPASVMGGLINKKDATNMCQSRQQPVTATTFEVIIGLI
jgi:hypothetical protein